MTTQDAFTSRTYVKLVEQSFSDVISAGQLTIAKTQYTARHFGNFFVEFSGPYFRLVVVRDRLQFMADFAAPSQAATWIDDETILNLIDARRDAQDLADADLRSVDQLAQVIRRHVPQILALFSTDKVADTLRKADDFRRERARRNYGYEADISPNGDG